MPPTVNNLQTLFEFAKAASGTSHAKVSNRDGVLLKLVNLRCRIVALQEILVDEPYSYSSIHTKNFIHVLFAHKKLQMVLSRYTEGPD